MEYFRLMQDKRVSNSIFMNRTLRIKNLDEASNGNVLLLKRDNVLPVTPAVTDIFPSVLDRQIFMVSRAVLNVILLFDLELQYRYFYLHDVKAKKFYSYYAPNIEMIDCLSTASVSNFDLSVVKKVVIKRDALPCTPLPEFFRVSNVEDCIVAISLEVAECILRRPVEGVRLDKIELE